jgi:mevalonate kinase
MTIEFSAPSKTFLAGEYAVLRGGPALVLNTEPRFALRAWRGPGDILKGIPEGSPAWHWLHERSPLLDGWNLEFSDPHGGRGGFGASSAQFLFVHCLTTFLQSSVGRVAQGLDRAALLNDFRVLSGGVASGADLLAQSVGQVAAVQPETGEVKGSAWPFSDLEFAIVRTGHKLPTHEHLKRLDTSLLSALVNPAWDTLEAFNRGQAGEFVDRVRAYAAELRRLGLQSEKTAALTDEIGTESWCLAAKGCGALGADTLLFLFEPARAADALAGLKRRGLDVVAGERDLGPGLQMKWTWPDEN